jgi:protein-tyrosine phosphatase
MLAACLVALFGTKPAEAIREIRQKRPFSIETYEQEQAVHQFALFLKSNREARTPESDGIS